MEEDTYQRFVVKNQLGKKVAYGAIAGVATIPISRDTKNENAVLVRGLYCGPFKTSIREQGWSPCCLET